MKIRLIIYEQSSAGVLKSRSSLKLLQNSQKNTSVGVSFLMKLSVGSLKPATLLKKDSDKGSSLQSLRNFEKHLEEHVGF